MKTSIMSDQQGSTEKILDDLRGSVSKKDYLFVLCNITAVLQNTFVHEATFRALVDGGNLHTIEAHYSAWATPNLYEFGSMKADTINWMYKIVREAKVFAERYREQQKKDMLIAFFFYGFLQKALEQLNSNARSKIAEMLLS